MVAGAGGDDLAGLSETEACAASVPGRRCGYATVQAEFSRARLMRAAALTATETGLHPFPILVAPTHLPHMPPCLAFLHIHILCTAPPPHLAHTGCLTGTSTRDSPPCPPQVGVLPSPPAHTSTTDLHPAVPLQCTHAFPPPPDYLHATPRNMRRRHINTRSLVRCGLNRC